MITIANGQCEATLSPVPFDGSFSCLDNANIAIDCNKLNDDVDSTGITLPNDDLVFTIHKSGTEAFVGEVLNQFVSIFLPISYFCVDKFIDSIFVKYDNTYDIPKFAKLHFSSNCIADKDFGLSNSEEHLFKANKDQVLYYLSIL